jgi:hypothetical protein
MITRSKAKMTLRHVIERHMAPKPTRRTSGSPIST